MNCELIVVGKTDMEQVATITQMYAKRINRYCKFGITILPDIRNTKSMSEAQQRVAEGEAIMRQLSDSDFVVLLDERGCEYSSVEFADWLQKRMNGGVKRLCFVVGGPYGFSEQVYKRANDLVSLSRMTFSHQIRSAIFTEQ